MKHIAIIGTVGVPAKYGGFETLVENIIGDNKSQNILYTVYCSAKSYPNKLKTYKGAELKYVNLNANGFQSIPYDIISILKAIRKSDVLLILGVSGSIILPFVRLFSKKKIIINIDGLEHRREKWSSKVRKLLKFLEKVAVRNCDVVVSDNKAIQDYVKEEYNKESVLIAYGGDHVLCDVANTESDILAKYDLKLNDFSFSLCRIEPENNVHVTLEAYKNTPSEKLVFVGNWDNSEYGKKLLLEYGDYSNIQLLQPIYDLNILNVLRKSCKFYLHGHSAGGTNPSLVEAMFFERPILCYNVIYNRESTDSLAHYFNSYQELTSLISAPIYTYEENRVAMLKIAKERYVWSIITKQYEELYK